MNIVQELFYLQDNHEEKLLSFKFFFDVMFCPTLGIATSLKVLWQKNFIFVRFMKNISHEKWRVVDWRKQLQKICFCPEKNAFLCSFYSFQLFYCDQSKCVECFFFTTWKHFDFLCFSHLTLEFFLMANRILIVVIYWNIYSIWLWAFCGFGKIPHFMEVKCLLKKLMEYYYGCLKSTWINQLPILAKFKFLVRKVSRTWTICIWKHRLSLSTENEQA